MIQDKLENQATDSASIHFSKPMFWFSDISKMDGVSCFTAKNGQLSWVPEDLRTFRNLQVLELDGNLLASVSIR